MTDSGQTEVHPIVRQIIDRDCHVGESYRTVIRHVVSKLRGGHKTFRRAAYVSRFLSRRFGRIYDMWAVLDSNQ